MCAAAQTLRTRPAYDTAGRKAAQGIAQAKLIEYDGAPHGLFASHKDRLASDVLAFLRS
jgi:non-heme chloroperoxidase